MRFISKYLIILGGALALACGGGGGGGGSSNSGGSVQDTTPPLLISTNPSNLSTGVPTNASLTATFSESITATAPSAAFTVLQGGTPVPGAVTFSGSTATFTPTTKLGASLTHTATVNIAIKDLAGNALATSHSWSFITSDCSAITLVRQFSLTSVPATAMFKALATDGTFIYLWVQGDFQATAGTIHKIDPNSGQVLSSTSLPLVPMSPASPLHGIQFIADIAWHNGALWASGVTVGAGGSFPQGVFRVNLVTGLAESEIPMAVGVAGENTILQGLASDGTNLYVAVDRNNQTQMPAHVVVKFNPATSAQIPLSPALLLPTGQATRLDHGGGSLWIFNNPDFQQVNPTTGAVLNTYCKTDGGANILYLNNAIWSIKDTVLMAYSL